MKTITQVEIQKNNRNKVSVYINDAFAFGAFLEDVLEYNIKKGRELSEEEYEFLLEKLQYRKAKFKALDYLGRGMKTEEQVKRKLREKEFEENIIERVIDFLKDYHYINDREFTVRYVEYSQNSKKKSIKQIQYELYQKGVDYQKIGNTLEDNDKLEEENIYYFLTKYKYLTIEDNAQKSKILNRLLRKGFQYDRIRKVIRNIEESFDR